MCIGLTLQCMSVNESFCVTGSDDGYVRLWPLDFKHVLLEAQHDGPVTGVDISIDCLRVLAATCTVCHTILGTVVRFDYYTVCICVIYCLCAVTSTRAAPRDCCRKFSPFLIRRYLNYKLVLFCYFYCSFQFFLFPVNCYDRYICLHKLCGG